MLPAAARHVADRLVTALMTLVRAVAPSDTPVNTLTLSEAATETLFFRLAHLVTQLIRISAFGVPTPTKPTTQTPDDTPPAAPTSRRTAPAAAATLPRRPGWLLAALPDIAPAVAAEISALLDDPAIATLLDSAPSLRRTLRPLLRGLDLAPPIPAPPQPPSSSTKPPDAPPPSAAAAHEPAADPRLHVETSPAEQPAFSCQKCYEIATNMIG